MNQFLNKFYKSHSLIYKIFLFVITTTLIVYLFPKSGTFRYSFEKGKPWQSENLYAPFDFAIQKSNEEIENEKIYLENCDGHINERFRFRDLIESPCDFPEKEVN